MKKYNSFQSNACWHSLIKNIFSHKIWNSKLWYIIKAPFNLKWWGIFRVRFCIGRFDIIFIQIPLLIKIKKLAFRKLILPTIDSATFLFMIKIGGTIMGPFRSCQGLFSPYYIVLQDQPIDLYCITFWVLLFSY